MKSKNGRKYTICLNMIVKNEAHCITGTFDNLLSFITFDYYVISDTGSTDGTQDVIRNYFKAKNIPGEIFQHEWKNFGFNRSKALEVAYNKTDALMIFDADDRLHGDFNLPDEIRADSYLLHFGSDVGYARPLLINNRKRFCFKGVLHEFLCPIGEGFSQTTLPGKYYVECGHSGSRSKDPEKYLKDARILEKAFEEENDRGLTNRYAFYCAQSYKDYGPTTHKDAIRWYKKVLELETWNQEKYYSCMMLGELCHMQGDDINSLKYFIKSIEYDRERIEGIAQATEYFRKKEFHVLVNLLYNKYKDYDKNPKDKLFINKILYNDFIEFNNSISAYYIDDKQSGYECCKKIFTNNIVDGQRLNNTFQNFKYYQNQVHHDKDISNYFQLVDDLICKRNEELGKDAYDVWNILFNKEKENLTKYREQFFKNKQKNPYVMITFTTCKRFDLFQQTMNSILNTWQDISKIDYWFCVDDNSSKEDRKLMKDKYPWIDYYLKNDEEKGHRKSMNIIWDKLKKLKPKYWIHMEDDFLFHKKMNYITDSVKYLNELKDKNVAQILFNRNYGEVIEDYKLMSHAKYNDEVVIQDYKDGYFGYANCHYWPNYSFRPSIVVTDVILKLGNFDSDNQFFEMDYAKRFTNEGYKSAFFNRICCKHIGRLTSERNDKSKPNAYELNNENQFSSEPVKSNVKVINLKRRTDRREKIVKVLKDANIKNYEIVEGVDGKTLIPTRNICKMFRGNDFGSRRGVIGCAITHYNLWISLLNDKENDYYMVIEDDMTVCDKFKEVVEKLENQFKEKEMLLLGYHMMTDVRERVKDIYDNGDFDNIKVDKLDMSLYLGGIHCYTINKKGAEKLVKFIAENGIKHGIDYIFKAYNILECWETRPLVAYADWNENGKQIDTDIQNLYESFNLNITERELLDKYECYYNQDFIGNDICYRNATDLFDMLMIAENTEGCVSFNTLGYFKNSMVVEKLSPLDNCNFYVKKSFLKNNKIIAFLYDDERILYFVRANQEVLGNKSIVL